MIWWFFPVSITVCLAFVLVVCAIRDGMRLLHHAQSQRAQHPISLQERNLRLHILQLEFMLHALPIVTAPAFAYLNNRKTLKDYDLPRIALIYSGAHRHMTSGRWQDAHGSALYAIRLCQRVITDVCLEVGLEKTRRDAENNRATAENNRAVAEKHGTFNHAFALHYFFDRYRYEPWPASAPRDGENPLPDYLARFDRLCAELSSMLKDSGVTTAAVVTAEAGKGE